MICDVNLPGWGGHLTFPSRMGPGCRTSRGLLQAQLSTRPQSTGATCLGLHAPDYLSKQVGGGVSWAACLGQSVLQTGGSSIRQWAQQHGTSRVTRERRMRWMASIPGAATAGQLQRWGLMPPLPFSSLSSPVSCTQLCPSLESSVGLLAPALE